MNLNDTTSTPWLLWAPLAAAAGHIFEEFALPGGFLVWYRGYRGIGVTSITPKFLIIVNIILLAVCWNAASAAHNPVHLPFWIGVCALLASNGVWHLYAAFRSRKYSPGMVTGLILYIPLAVYGCAHFLYLGKISWIEALLASAIGGSYPIWSDEFHRRRVAV